jgi:nitrite reductase/ring-hydroxylating ferredoxin subunit
MEIDTTRVLCTLAQLEPTGCREFRLGSGEWPVKGFVVRVAGGARAYLNRCAHLAYPLNYLPDRFLSHDGAVILCTAHGALYEKDSGLCISGPCAGAALVRLPVQIVAGYVLLDGAEDPAELAARYA